MNFVSDSMWNWETFYSRNLIEMADNEKEKKRRSKFFETRSIGWKMPKIEQIPSDIFLITKKKSQQQTNAIDSHIFDADFENVLRRKCHFMLMIKQREWRKKEHFRNLCASFVVVLLTPCSVYFKRMQNSVTLESIPISIRIFRNTLSSFSRTRQTIADQTLSNRLTLCSCKKLKTHALR